jgi:hypothetical protein
MNLHEFVAKKKNSKKKKKNKKKISKAMFNTRVPITSRKLYTSNELATDYRLETTDCGL